MTQNHVAQDSRTGRPRLLFLCQTLPFPPDSGVHIRSFNVLRLLARAFDVTGLFFFRQATRPTPESIRVGLEGLRALGDASVFPIPQEESWLRLVWDHLRSVLTRRAYTYYTHESAAFQRTLEHVLRETDFDVVHLDSLDLSRYLPMVREIPVVCTHHNVESSLLLRRSENQTSRAVARYLRFQARLTQEEEARWCERVALNITVSSDDSGRLREIADGARIVTIPNGVDTKAFRPGHGPEDGIVFVGGSGWYPNSDGMLYFAEEILPLVRRRKPDIDVTWVGRASDDMRREFASKYGITLTGYVDDITALVQRAACYVVPLRIGGGTRLKILDAWAMGKAVVSTSIGCEGLDIRDGENILVRDTPTGFAEAVLHVLENRPARSALGAEARRTAEARYDWEVIGRDLVGAYRSILKTRTDVPGRYQTDVLHTRNTAARRTDNARDGLT